MGNFPTIDSYQGPLDRKKMNDDERIAYEAYNINAPAKLTFI